jgi:hypothetical protein
VLSAPSAHGRGERAGRLLFTISNSHERFSVRYLMPAIRPVLSLFTSVVPTRHSQLASSRSPPPVEGRAERRWRSDACEAPVSARLTRSRNMREHACDRRAVASLDQRKRAEAGPMRSLRMPGEPGLRSISQTGRADLREALAFPATGTLAFRRSTWDFWPGPVLAVVRHSLRDRAGNLICRTGHRYPEEQVSRTSPGRPLTASGDTTASARLARTPLEGAPQDRG